MIAYNCDSNTILQVPFVNRKDKHRIRAYNSIMQKLADRGHHVDIQILDNEVSAKFKKTVKNIGVPHTSSPTQCPQTKYSRKSYQNI